MIDHIWWKRERRWIDVNDLCCFALLFDDAYGLLFHVDDEKMLRCICSAVVLYVLYDALYVACLLCCSVVVLIPTFTGVYTYGSRKHLLSGISFY